MWVKKTPCNQSKRVKPVYYFSPFQDGRSFSAKARNTGGILGVQTGSDGCMLQCAVESKIE